MHWWNLAAWFAHSALFICSLFLRVLSFASLESSTLKNSIIYCMVCIYETPQRLGFPFLSKIGLVWILRLTSGLNPSITCWQVGIRRTQNFHYLTYIFKTHTKKAFGFCGTGPELSTYENYMQQALPPRKAESNKQYLLFLYVLYGYLAAHGIM